MSRQISVVIPVFNGEKYLAEAIDSCLQQTRPPREILVIDDGSTDHSAEIAGSFGPSVRCEAQAKAGAAAARNRGIDLAAGSYLAFLDADDYWNPEKLEIQAGHLDRELACDMVFGTVRAFHSPELSEEERKKLALPPDMRGRVPGSMLIRRGSIHRVGTFATQWGAGEFLEWYGRAKSAGLQEAHTEGTTLFRRIHRDNYMRRHAATQRDYLKILKAALDRKRHSEG